MEGEEESSGDVRGASSQVARTTTLDDLMSIVARFGIGGAFRDPGSIDTDRGSGTPVDRCDSLLSRNPVRAVSVSIISLDSRLFHTYLGLFRLINTLNSKHHI
jgi:hypothetical protein